MTRLRVGVLTPHASPGPEVEIPTLSHGDIAIITVRAGSPSELRAGIRPQALEDAASTFLSSQVDAVLHASTTTAYLIGATQEDALVAELRRLCGVPAFASGAAAVAAFQAHGAQRIQLVHPPWFAEAYDNLGIEYFASRELEAVVSRATQLPTDPALVTTEHVINWVQQHVRDDVDGVYLAGSGFRTAAAASELERRTGKVIVSANLALHRAVVLATT